MSDLTALVKIDDWLIQCLCDGMGVDDDDEFYEWLSRAAVKFLIVDDLTRRFAKATIANVEAYSIIGHCYAEVSDDKVTFISDLGFYLVDSRPFRPFIYCSRTVTELDLGGVNVIVENKEMFSERYCNILLNKSNVCIRQGSATYGMFSKSYAYLIDISNIRCDIGLNIMDCFLNSEIDELMADNLEITVNECKDALRDYSGDIMSFRNCKAKINCDFTLAINNTRIGILDVSRTSIEFDDTVWDKSNEDIEESRVHSVIANDTVVNEIDKFMKILKCLSVREFTTNVSELQLAWNRLKGIES